MSAEKFCLKWNDFEKNISGSFRELKDDEDFFDVTLTCDADKQVSAHKVILSACSPFFRQILRRHKHHPHPLLYLRGVSFSDLESVLAFMYHGEVNIAQEQLNSFLAVAEDLKVKGLTQGRDGGQTEKPSERTAGGSQPPPTKRPRQHQQQQQLAANYEDTDEEIQEVVPVVKTEAGVGSAVVLDEAKDELQGFEENLSYGDFSGGYEDPVQYEGAGGFVANTQSGHDISKGGTDKAISGPGDLDQYIVLGEDPSRKFGCGFCNNFFNHSRTNVRNHLESKHFSGYFSYSCDICSKVLHTNNALIGHKKKFHKH